MARKTLPPGNYVDLGSFKPPVGPERPMRAYLPATWAPGVPHPLLVMFDGQNVFGDHGSYAGGWHVQEAVDGLTARTLTAPIVVAIHNGGTHRIHEIGTWVHRFVDAVANQALPQIEERFATRSPRVLAGASLGGLAALVGWFNHPEAFDSALAMSPSLWFGNQRVFRELAGAPLPPRGRLYVDAGGRENGRMFHDAELLTQLLAARGLGEDRLLWRPDQRGTHQERHWRRRLPKALRFLFRR